MARLDTLLIHPDPILRQQLRRMLEPVDFLRVLGEAASAEEALALFDAVGHGVFFTGITLEGSADGMELARQLLGRRHRPALVFIAAEESRAFEAFELDATDYLIFPCAEDRFARTVARLRQFRTHFRLAPTPGERWRESHTPRPPQGATPAAEAITAPGVEHAATCATSLRAAHSSRMALATSLEATASPAPQCSSQHAVHHAPHMSDAMLERAAANNPQGSRIVHAPHKEFEPYQPHVNDSQSASLAVMAPYEADAELPPSAHDPYGEPLVFVSTDTPLMGCDQFADPGQTVQVPLAEEDQDSFLSALGDAWDYTSRIRPVELDKLAITQDGTTMLVPYSEISFVEAYEDYSYVHTATDKYLTSYRLKNLESRLRPHRFFRVHRKFLVNLDMVTELATVSGGNCVLRTTGRTRIELPISRRRLGELKTILGL